VSHLKRKLADMNIEKEKLRNEMIGLAHALDKKEDMVRNLEHRINSNKLPQSPTEMEQVLSHENDSLKLENRSLKDKIHQHQVELDRIVRA